MTDRPTPECDALCKSALDSNDLRAWQSLADRLERKNAELREVLKGMLAIEDSVTQGLEKELRAKWIPIARAALARKQP